MNRHLPSSVAAMRNSFFNQFNVLQELVSNYKTKLALIVRKIIEVLKNEKKNSSEVFSSCRNIVIYFIYIFRRLCWSFEIKWNPHERIEIPNKLYYRIKDCEQHLYEETNLIHIASTKINFKCVWNRALPFSEIPFDCFKLLVNGMIKLLKDC